MDTIFNLLIKVPFELRMILIMAVCLAIFATYTYIGHRISTIRQIRKEEISMFETTAYEIIAVNGHYEVFQEGKFICSADTYTEALREISNIC